MQVDLSLAYLSTASASIDLQPFGTLRIDPALAVGFPAILIPQPAGVASVAFTIPNAPSLSGVELHCQSMLVSFPSELRLSNAVVDVVQ